MPPAWAPFLDTGLETTYVGGKSDGPVTPEGNLRKHRAGIVWGFRHAEPRPGSQPLRGTRLAAGWIGREPAGAGRRQRNHCRDGRLATCFNPSDGIAAADALVLTLVGGPDETA